MDYQKELEADKEALFTEDKKKAPKKQKGESKAPKVTLFSKIQDDPVKTVRQLISVTESAMQSRVSVWDRHRRKYRRGLYYLRTLSSGVPLYFTNYIFSNIEATKANLTRNLPKMIAAPRGLRDDVAADLMTRIMEDALMRGGMKRVLREVVHQGLLATMGYFKVYFSDNDDALIIDAPAPEDMLIDPKAKNLDDARWIIHRQREVSVDEIFATYGSVPKETGVSEAERSDDALHDREGLYTTTGELKPAIEVAGTYDVYECWVRCWDEDRENDWYIVTMAGGTVLREEFSVYDHGRHPFVVWFAGEDFAADNIYHRGIGAVEEIEPLQDRADAIDLKIYKHISLFSNRQRYVSSQSGINAQTMDTTAGRTYVVNGDPSRAVFYDNPSPMPQEIYNYRDRTEPLIQTVSGIFDVTQGRRPTGITAGRAIESLKDSAETRLSTLLDTVAEAMDEVGNLALSIILQFYSGERLIKSTDGDKENDFLIIADYPEELQPQPMPTLDEFGMPMMDEATGGYVIDESEPMEVDEQLLMMREEWKAQAGIALVLSDVKYEWDVKTTTDSALPSARAERGQIASELFRLGAIDREALLEALDYPQRHRILKRLMADVTGKDAGDPAAEAGQGQTEMMMQGMMQLLVELGIPQDQAMQMLEQAVSGGQQQGPETGAYQPQMTM